MTKFIRVSIAIAVQLIFIQPCMAEAPHKRHGNLNYEDVLKRAAHTRTTEGAEIGIYRYEYRFINNKVTNIYLKGLRWHENYLYINKNWYAQLEGKWYFLDQQEGPYTLHPHAVEFNFNIYKDARVTKISKTNEDQHVKIAGSIIAKVFRFFYFSRLSR